MQRLKWHYHKNAAGALYKQQRHMSVVTATETDDDDDDDDDDDLYFLLQVNSVNSNSTVPKRVKARTVVLHLN